MRLSQMPLRELVAMEARVQAALIRKRDEQRKAVISEIHVMLKGSGFTARELFGNGRRKPSLLTATMPKGKKLGVIGSTVTERRSRW